MESARRLMSSRASARPLSTAINRPLTGMTSATGLMPPKSSRATASVRRQIQDKSYYLALINAKMNELNQEIARLTRATDQMKTNESRINLMQQAAASLAKDLKEKSSTLSAYNEYFERLRFEDSIDEVDKEIELVRADNDLLIEELECKYKDKKETEKALSNLENNFKTIQGNLSNFLIKLEPHQQQRYRELDQQNKQFNSNCEQLEQQIVQLKHRINQLEGPSDLEADSIFRKEVLHSLERLRQLENQHEELFAGFENNYEDERSRLLAQVKRDNRTINQLEQDHTNLDDEFNKLKQLDEEYSEENVVRYNEYHSQEKTIDNLLIDYKNKRSENLEEIRNLSTKIRKEMENSSRFITQASILKDSDPISAAQSTGLSNEMNEGQSSDSKLQLILDEKRKLTLDLAKIEQLKGKVSDELSTLKLQIKKLNTDIKNFENVQQLKEQARVKLDRLNDRRCELNGKLDQLGELERTKKQQFDKFRNDLERENSIHRKLSKYENRLVDLEQRSNALYDEIGEYDYEHLKIKAFEEMSKYNQKLLGF